MVLAFICKIAGPLHVVQEGVPNVIPAEACYLVGAILYLVGIPIALGSWWGLFVLALMMPALIWRLFDEEKFLVKNLDGYAEYKSKVKHRLVPFIW